MCLRAPAPPGSASTVHYVQKSTTLTLSDEQGACWRGEGLLRVVLQHSTAVGKDKTSRQSDSQLSTGKPLMCLIRCCCCCQHCMLPLFTAAGMTAAQRAIKEGAIKDAKDAHIWAAACKVCSDHARDLFLRGNRKTGTVYSRELTPEIVASYLNK